MNGVSDVFLKWIAGVLLVAILAVIVSKNSSAAKVVQAFTAGFTNILATVVGPINSGAAQQAADTSTQAPSSSTTATNAGSSQQSGTGTGTGTGGSAPVTDSGTGAASATDSQNNTTTGH